MSRRYYPYRPVDAALKRRRSYAFENVAKPLSLALVARAVVSRAAIAFLFFTVPVIADTATEAHTDRLINSSSPYLLENAHNPVDLIEFNFC
jgi:hypothetical protein